MKSIKEVIKIQKWLVKNKFVIIDWKFSPNEFELSTHILVNKKKDCVFIQIEEDLSEGKEFNLELFKHHFYHIVERREIKIKKIKKSVSTEKK